MSAPPPYQNHPPQQQYGGYPQQQYGSPQPPRGPQRPQRQASPLRALINIVIVLAVLGGGAWYVWDYNTNPHGGKAQEEREKAAKQEAYDKKYNPKVGDCVKVKDPHGEPQPEIVDCGSPEAEYKTGEILPRSDSQCPAKYDYGIQYSSRRGANYTLCFTKV